MTKKFIILCGRYRFFFFLIVLPWFGHVFSNKGRFGHKRRLPGFFYFLIWFLGGPNLYVSWFWGAHGRYIMSMTIDYNEWIYCWY